MYWRLLQQPFRRNCRKKTTLISLLSSNKTLFQIFFVLFFSFVAYLASAQTDPLEKKVNIVAQNEPLENVLSQISQQTGVRFSYNSQLINPKTKVTVNTQNKAVRDVLSTILPSPVSYKKVGEHIVFYAESRKPESRKPESRKQKAESEEQETENFSSNNGTPKDDCLDSISLIKKEDMKSQIAGLLVAAATLSATVSAQDTLVQDTRKTDTEQAMEIQQEVNCKPAQLTFIYPLGTGGAYSAKNCYHFSVNILCGVTEQTRGFEVGGLFNINRYGSIGMQAAGLFNIAGVKNTETRSYNVQFAGLANHTRKGVSVIQYAGLANNADTAYLQGGGLFNIAKEAGAQGGGLFNVSNKAILQGGGLFNIAKEAGAQGGGLFNVSNKAILQAGGLFNVSDVSYCQLAGLFNMGGVAHFQAAGLWNYAKETKWQLAGLWNVAEESTCQIASLVNVTKKGGFQMGLINVRDTADGVSLGLINIVKKGGILEAGIEAGEFVHTAVTFRSGVKCLYSIISVGYNYIDNFWAVGTGLGTSVKLIGNLSLNLELRHTTLYNSIMNYERQWCSLSQFAPVLNYRFAKHFKMYLGPSLNLLNTYYSFDKPYTSVPYSFYNKAYHHYYGNGTLNMWVGVVGGIKF
jgi:hypothetical protein